MKALFGFGLVLTIGCGRLHYLPHEDARPAVEVGMPSDGGRDAAGSDIGALDAFAPDVWSLDAPDAGTLDTGVGRDARDLDAGSLDDAMRGDAEGACGSVEGREVLERINATRLMDGVLPLACDAQIASVAQAHSLDMCTRTYFDHRNPEGQTHLARLSAAGVVYVVAGETIAQGQPSAASVHAAWTASPGHRATLVDARYGRVGVGLARCGGLNLWTADFAD